MDASTIYFNISELYDSEMIDDEMLSTDWSTVIINSILFVISSIGNTTMLYFLLKQRFQWASRMNKLLIHSCLADLIVTFIYMPTQIAWTYAVPWNSIDWACRAMSYFKILGFYLKSYVLICIAVDRLLAVLKPSRMGACIMVTLAWICAMICSFPQAFYSYLEEYSEGLYQCLTVMSSNIDLLKYYLWEQCTMFVLPLICFTICYTIIYLNIYNKNKLAHGGKSRSSSEVLDSTDRRATDMCLTIAVAFIGCWTPYFIVNLWYQIVQDFAIGLSPWVLKFVIMVGTANPCINPIIFGVFNYRKR